MSGEKNPFTCPICGKGNGCNLAGQPIGSCWCSRERFPAGLLALVPTDQRGKACICKACLDRFIQRIPQE
ncbi:cysteine-rich CWC family protein [Laceyella putida]|uniref:Cysteine-rich CWC family protein n=1 Tax=Laceyella putida TaxID=110101 RepID=A0ABW2RHI5_9BACL